MNILSRIKFRVEYLCRYLFFLVLGILLMLFYHPKKRNPKKRILIIRTEDRLGELLLTTPLIRAISKQSEYPLDVLVIQGREDVFNNCPWVKKVYSYPKGFKLISKIKLIKLLRINSYKIVIDASHRHEPTHDILLTFLIGQEERIGHKRGPYYIHYTTTIELDSNNKHEIDRNLELVRGLSYHVCSNRMWSPPSSKKGLIKELLGFINNNKIVTIHTGARLKKRRIPLCYIYKLIKRLNLKHIYFLVISDNIESTQIQGDNCYNVRYCKNDFTLQNLVYIFKQSKFVITANSGILHLSIATGTPTLGLFFDGSISRWGYNDSKNECIVVKDKSVIDMVIRTINRKFLERRT